MSTENAISNLFAALQDTAPEDAAGFALVEGLAALGARHRAAEALAEEEYLLGIYVDETELSEASVLLAAQDEDAPAPGRAVVYSGGRVRVRVQATETGLSAVQEGGARGLSLRTHAGLLPLQPGVPVLLPGLSGFPEELECLDRRGALLRLTPSLPEPHPG